MKRLIAFLAAAGTLGISGNASATAGDGLSLRNNVRSDPAVTRRHDALGRLRTVAPNTTSYHPISTLHSATAFDWSDAAVGFGSGIALIGLAGAVGRRVHPGARGVS